MHFHSDEEICSNWPFMPLFFPANATDQDESSANREKSASDNERSKSEYKSSANKEESADNNNRNQTTNSLLT